MPNFDVYRQQWQKMQELPEFQQLEPQQQAKLQQRFFTKLVMADPEIKTAASTNPKLIPQMHRDWYGPQEPTPFLGTAVGGGIADFLSMFTPEAYKASAEQAGQGLAETAAGIGGFEGERIKRGLVETSRGIGGLVGPPLMAAAAPIAIATGTVPATAATIGGVLTARYGAEKGLEKLEQSGYDYDRPLAELGIEALSWLVPSKTSKEMRQRLWKKLTDKPAAPPPPPPAAAAAPIPIVEPPVGPTAPPTLSSFPEVGPEGIAPANPYNRGPRSPASPVEAMSMVPKGPDIMSSIPGMKMLPEMGEAEVPAASAPKKSARPDRPAAALPPPQPSLEARVTESPSVPKAPEPVAPAASPQRRLRDFGPPRGQAERRRELPARTAGPMPRRAQAAPLTIQSLAPEGVTPELEAAARAFLGVPEKPVEAPRTPKAAATFKPLKGTEILRLKATPEELEAPDIPALKARVEAEFKEIGKAMLANEALSAKQKENAATRHLLRRDKIMQLIDEGKLSEATEATKPAAGEVKAHLEAERAEAKRQRDRERMAAKRTVAGQEATPESFAVGDETRIERAAAEDAAQIQRRAAGSFTDVEAPPSEIVKAGNINELPEGELPPLEGAATGAVDVPQLAAAKAEVRATAKKLGRHDTEIVELEKFVDTLVLLGRTPAAAAQEVATGLGVVRAAKGSKGSKAAERTEERLRAREERTEEVELSRNFERVDDSGEIGAVGDIDAVRNQIRARRTQELYRLREVRKTADTPTQIENLDNDIRNLEEMLASGIKSDFSRKGELGFIAGDLPMTLIKGILKIPGAIDQGLQSTYTKYLGGPAYEMAAALPERMFRSLSTIVGRPNSFERTFLPRSTRLSPKYLAADRKRIAASDEWTVKGKKVMFDLSDGLTQDAQQALGKFQRGEFTQAELRRVRNDPQWQETVDNAKISREWADSLQHAAFQENMISAETHARTFGKYVPTMYREYIDLLQAKQRGASGTHLRKMRLDLDRFRKEKGIPLEVKMDLGWIQEPAYPMGKGLAQAGKALELNRFFSEVSKNPEWVKADVKDIPAGEVGDWLPLPKDLKLGALSGKYARKWLYDDLEVHRIAPGMIEAVLEAGLSEWKFSKVVMGTSPQIRNVYTNAILQFMGGLSPHRLDIYSRAFRDVWQNVHPKKGMSTSASYEQARKHGLFGSGTTFTEAEMAGFIDSWNKSSGNLWQRMSQMGREFMDASVPEKARKVARVVTASKLGRMLEGKTVKGVTVDPARWYQMNEHVFRYAKFLHNIEQKMTPDAAVADALKWSIDFSDMPPAVKWTGRLSSPFIAFPAGALPRFGEAMLKYPWRVMLGMTILEEAEKRSKIALGMSDEEHEQIEKSLPRRLQSPIEFPARQMAQRGLSMVPGMPESATQYGGKLAGQIFTRSHLLRWREQGTGRLQFADLSYILPWGDIAEQGPPGVATEGLPLSQHIASHPAMRIPWELWTNENLAFGGDIVRPEDQQSALRTGWAWTKYLQKQLQPNIMPPFGYGFEAMAKPLWSKVDPEYRGHLDYSGRPRVLPQATLGAIGGIKITPIDPEEELDRTLDGIDGQIQELKKRQNIIGRDERMTDAQRDTQIERIDAQIDSLYEKKDQY